MGTVDNPNHKSRYPKIPYSSATTISSQAICQKYLQSMNRRMRFWNLDSEIWEMKILKEEAGPDF
ncbi:hypothetical protein PVL29_014764 [Vitis rotundifolia]|uniref:Uncharacterized protein n=1 Tax=Vitis rotundifolia TaxID=103349 RepID=A0AA38ZHN4_VITRO|nr:hypothetical protein PVL29_014764 [Vitis rotundifolia]